MGKSALRDAWNGEPNIIFWVAGHTSSLKAQMADSGIGA